MRRPAGHVDPQRHLIHEFLLVLSLVVNGRAGRDEEACQTFTNRDPAQTPVTGFSTGAAILGDAPARLVINRQEAVLAHAPIGQQRRRAGAGHQEA